MSVISCVALAGGQRLTEHQFLDLSKNNGGKTCGLLCEKRAYFAFVVSSYLLGFCVRSMLEVLFYLILTLRGQFSEYSRESYFRVALGYLEPAFFGK